MVVMLTSFRRWNSGAAIYLRSQAGKVGEKILRYSRREGVRGRRARSLQVARLMDFSLEREKRLDLTEATGVGSSGFSTVGVAGSSSITWSQTVGVVLGGR